MTQIHSIRIQSALDKIHAIQGKPLPPAHREEQAIELAALMLEEAMDIETGAEKAQQKQLSRMMLDSRGKAFTTDMTDQCFRTKTHGRVANQLSYLVSSLGVPKYLHWMKRWQLRLFRLFAPLFSFILVPLLTFLLRRETRSVILSGEPKALQAHIRKRKKQGVRINLNHLGEAILGEAEAKKRLQVYLDDLANPEIEYVSIKISTIYSQIHLLAWDKTLAILSTQLRQLYRAAMQNSFSKPDGTKSQKFVNLDMEEYKDLHLTKALFMQVLDEPEFFSFSAGIVLQAYLPDAFLLQKELTKWAQGRVSTGGAPIKIRIVKGANLAMERFEASIRGWPQAPYREKNQVDTNYKRMVSYGCQKENARAVSLGIGSHNLFDIAYAILLRAENQVESQVTFEMLEGMADHMRRVVQVLTGDILLYCPVATKKDFQSAVAYLMRRLDENTGEENFLRHTFGLRVGSSQWADQVRFFLRSCHGEMISSIGPRRQQNRFSVPDSIPFYAPFQNEADTDFSLEKNREWAKIKILEEWRSKKIPPIPCVIGGKEILLIERKDGFDPSYPKSPLYQFSPASWKEADLALSTAKLEEISWQAVSIEERAKILSKAAQILRENRHNLIGVMAADGGKAFLEGDAEVSEAIDFAEYYLRSSFELHGFKDISWKPKGTILVTPPWNFPIAIPAGGILAALAAGNCVIFKPASEAILCGWTLVNLLWEAGIPKNVLQFVPCPGQSVGAQMIADPRVNGVILTGGTDTARKFLQIRPSLDLYAETGGKNSIIITALSDRDLAIKDLIHSAFGHSGQKCSAASLAILEKEVYDDPHFLSQLKDAVESLTVGSPWDLSPKVTPLIHPPKGALLQALTLLEEGESWLVEPKQTKDNPNLWSPGVKLGIKPGSFMHQTELFGPVLGIMRAENLCEAIEISIGTPYGLTAGIHSLDVRELKTWLQKIEAGNLYINRGITGAIVQRQPFGGCKASSFGPGAKAGGPNYLFQFVTLTQENEPTDGKPLTKNLKNLAKITLSTDPSIEKSLSNYLFWADKLSIGYDLEHPKNLSDHVVGEDNVLFYTPKKSMGLRIEKEDCLADIVKIIGAALICGTKLEVSYVLESAVAAHIKQLSALCPCWHFIEESSVAFAERVTCGHFRSVRIASCPGESLMKAAASSGCFLDKTPVLHNGRFELLHYLQEVSLSYDYHRYGNLGLREKEERNAIL